MRFCVYVFRQNAEKKLITSFLFYTCSLTAHVNISVYEKEHEMMNVNWSFVGTIGTFIYLCMQKSSILFPLLLILFLLNYENIRFSGTPDDSYMFI